jgi:hypothetical protein
VFTCGKEVFPYRVVKAGRDYYADGVDIIQKVVIISKIIRAVFLGDFFCCVFFDIADPDQGYFSFFFQA